jgi:hypothetical protein
MSNLEKIKQIAEQMPDCPEKERGLQAYANLKTFETIADSFDRLINLRGRKNEHHRPTLRKDKKWKKQTMTQL